MAQPPQSLEVHERREGDHIVFIGKINQITEEMEAIVTIDKRGLVSVGEDKFQIPHLNLSPK